MDYCTLFPEGWWATCCEIHDSEYAMQIGKELADNNLFHCVVNSGTDPLTIVLSVVVATVMWVGVRMFGNRFYKGSKK